MNARRLARLFRKRAALSVELSRIDESIADEYDGTAASNDNAARADRPRFQPDMDRPVDPLALQQAKRRLRRASR